MRISQGCLFGTQQISSRCILTPLHTGSGHTTSILRTKDDPILALRSISGTNPFFSFLRSSRCNIRTASNSSQHSSYSQHLPRIQLRRSPTLSLPLASCSSSITTANMATLTDPKQATNQPIRKPKIPIPLDENGAPIYPTRRAKPPPKTSNLTKPTAANGALVFPTRTYQPPATASFVVHHHGGEGAGTRVFAPRVGTFTLRRAKAPKWSWRNSTGAALDVGVDVDDDGDGVVKTEDVIRLDTPGMICGTSQGTVKHLTRDHVALGAASGCGNGSTTWIHVPFEKLYVKFPFKTSIHQMDATNLPSFFT